MKHVTPNCFKDFNCRGGVCSDNCCIGWEIDIDEETLHFFDALKDGLKQKLDCSISREGTPHFILNEKERCPFLNKDNLCDVIINYGEEKIPYICRNHPRFYTWLPDRCEVGMGLCCEAACDLIFASENKLDIFVSEKHDNSVCGALSYARKTAYSILQNRKFPLWSRLGIFLEYCNELDEYLFFEDPDMLIKTADKYTNYEPVKITKARSIRKICELFSSLIPIDENWSKLAKDILKNASTIDFGRFHNAIGDKIYNYEHLAVYFTYRHFMNSAEDMNLLDKANFIVLATVYTGICDAYSYTKSGKFSTKETARLISKQVEYSLENTQKVSESEITNIKGLLPMVFGR